MKKSTTGNVVKKTTEMRRELNEQFTVTRIGVFGSYARGDERSESDIDIIAELAEPTFDHYVGPQIQT